MENHSWEESEGVGLVSFSHLPTQTHVSSKGGDAPEAHRQFLETKATLLVCHLIFFYLLDSFLPFTKEKKKDKGRKEGGKKGEREREDNPARIVSIKLLYLRKLEENPSN